MFVALQQAAQHPAALRRQALHPAPFLFPPAVWHHSARQCRNAIGTVRFTPLAPLPSVVGVMKMARVVSLQRPVPANLHLLG